MKEKRFLLFPNHLRSSYPILKSFALPLAFHTARHTYATEITLSHGVPLETVSKMLGHTRVETTQIYAKITDDKISSDTIELDSKISDRFTIII